MGIIISDVIRVIVDLGLNGRFSDTIWVPLIKDLHLTTYPTANTPPPHYCGRLCGKVSGMYGIGVDVALRQRMSEMRYDHFCTKARLYGPRNNLQTLGDQVKHEIPFRRS